MVEAANRGPGGAGLSNTTYVTPQELRIQGEGSKHLYGKQFEFIGEFLISWSFLGIFRIQVLPV